MYYYILVKIKTDSKTAGDFYIIYCTVSPLKNWSDHWNPLKYITVNNLHLQSAIFFMMFLNYGFKSKYLTETNENKTHSVWKGRFFKKRL